MSYIDVYELNGDDARMVVEELENNRSGATVSATDGEELYAAAAVISMIDALDNGELLIIRRVLS